MEPAGEMWSVVIEFEKETEDARIDNVVHRIRRQRQALEIGRVLHIGRGGVPGIGETAGHLDLAPGGVAGENILVAGLECLARHVGADELGDLLRAWPDVAEIDRLALAVLAERIGGEVDVHRAGQRIGDDQRRRGEIVGADVGIDAAFEIAIAGEHGGRDQIMFADGFGDRLRKRAGIADTGGAAITDEIEAELVELLLQTGTL